MTARTRTGASGVSSDTKWIIGAIIGAAGLLLAQGASINARIDAMRADIRAIDDRLRQVEIGLAEVKIIISGEGQRPSRASAARR